MSDIWCQMSFVWCPMGDFLCLMSDIRCLMSDVWCSMYDVAPGLSKALLGVYSLLSPANNVAGRMSFTLCHLSAEKAEAYEFTASNALRWITSQVLQFLSSVFTHVASIFANLLGQKRAFTYEKNSTPTGKIWNSNMAAVSLFSNTNMAAVTSCENTLSGAD